MNQLIEIYGWSVVGSVVFSLLVALLVEGREGMNLSAGCLVASFIPIVNTVVAVLGTIIGLVASFLILFGAILGVESNDE
jgi:hypothetical protein